MQLQSLFHSWRQLILYLFFGVCTTLINVIVYWLCARVLLLSLSLSTVIAWFAAVLFAFFTNRDYVFEAKNASSFAWQLGSFFAMRALTGFLDLAFMVVTVEMLGLDDLWMKLFSNGLVIILNFVFSKWIVFRKRDAVLEKKS